MSPSCWGHSPEVSFLHLLNPCLLEAISYSVWFMKNGTRSHTEPVSPGELRRQRWVPPAEYLRLHRIPRDLWAGPPAGSYSNQGFFKVNDRGESTEAGSLCSWGWKLKSQEGNKCRRRAGQSTPMWVTHGWSRPPSNCCTTPWTGNGTDPLSFRGKAGVCSKTQHEAFKASKRQVKLNKTFFFQVLACVTLSGRLV